jgi:uncharacterized protein (DUF427 family)
LIRLVALWEGTDGEAEEATQEQEGTVTQLLEDMKVSGGDGEHRLRTESCPKRVRAYVGPEAVADSTSVRTMFESGHLPVYYFPLGDVREEFFVESEHHTVCPYKGTASYYSVKVGDRLVENAAWTYPTPIESAPAGLAGHVAFYWDKMDAWFEEDEEVFVHPRDPYKRVDTLHSSRHIEVRIGGKTVSDTRRAVLLFETYLPTRYYVPKLDVRLDLLEDSEKLTRCPYKGEASYYSVRIGDDLFPDIAWFYRHPTLECSKIENMVCFFNEKVDEIIVDGEPVPKPNTQWS